MNNITDPDTLHWQEVHRSFLHFLKFAFPILSIISLVGTATLLIVLLWKKKEIRYPTSTNLAICWLLVTDLGFLLLRWAEFLGKVGFIPFRVRDVSLSACHGWVTFYALFTVQQSYIQCVISIERCLAVLYPLKVKTIFTWRRMLIILIVASFLGFTIAVFHVLFGFTIINGRCDPNPVHGVKLAICSLITWVLMPGIILVTCTVCIVSVLFLRLRKLEVAVRRRNLSSPEIRLSLMLVAMDTVFMTTCLPLSIFYFQLHYLGQTPMLLMAWDVSVFLMSTGAFTDWLIILILGGRIRQAFRSFWRDQRNRSSSMAMSSSTERKMSTRITNDAI